LVNSSWKDLDVHGRRLNKILKILDKKFDKIPKEDIDGLARIAATIGNITRHAVEIIKIVDMYDEIKKIHDEDMKEIRQQKVILRKWNREEPQRKKEALRREIEFEKQVVEQEENQRIYQMELDAKNAEYDRKQREKEELEL